MSSTVFYSWQQDTPKDIGDGFIEEALNAALRELHTDVTIDKALRELQLDRDTKNTPGQPPIADTILRKIDNATVFVPDLTFVGKRLDRKRLTPNPNVLIEYGYAIKALGHERIVPVMNTHYGEPSDSNMPFDMKHLRHPIQYRLGPDASSSERTRVLTELIVNLKESISAVLKKLPAPPSAKPFTAHGSGATLGRFRPPGNPIGEGYDPFLSFAGNKNSNAITLADGPVVWLKVYPAFDPDRKWLFTEIYAKVKERIGLLGTIWFSGDMGYVRSTDGFGIYALNKSNQNVTNRVTFIFTTGEIWSVGSDVIGRAEHRGRAVIPDMTQIFARCLKNHSDFLIALGISPPFKWQAGMEGTQDLPMVTELMPGIPQLSSNCLEWMISANGDFDPNSDPITALRPFTEKLYDSCGLPPPPANHNNLR